MPSRMDESVLAHCPELQSIPMNKPQLAAIAGGKIYRPQQAAYMFQNLPISKAQKESLLLDFVERSMKTNPITIPAHRYANRVTDKISVVPSTTRAIITQGTQTNIVTQILAPVQVASAALAAHVQGTQTNIVTQTQASSSNAPIPDWQDLVIRDPDYSKQAYKDYLMINKSMRERTANKKIKSLYTQDILAEKLIEMEIELRKADELTADAAAEFVSSSSSQNLGHV
jgi:hypothetical protein